MKTVLIAGAGIIGIATALELASRANKNDLEITVLDRGQAMQESSWAAAGMLAANDPENPVELAPLAQLSLSLYPEFLRRIEHLSGQHIPLRTNQTLQLCPAEHVPPGAARLSQAEAAARIPGLNPDLRGSLLWLDESSLDPRDLCRALPTAVRAAGVRIVEDCAVHSIHLDQAGVTAHTSRRSYQADALIVCCGAWPMDCFIAGTETQNFSTPSLPRKGQMISVRMPSDKIQLGTVIRSPEIYLVPRDVNPEGSRIIIGATVEDAGFDRSTDPRSTSWLLEKAAALWPPIRKGDVEEVWTGLRPGTPDGLPFIGPMQPVPARSNCSEKARLWLAAGHFRNGILLAPATAHIVARQVLETLLETRASHAPSIDVSPFSPARMTHADGLFHFRQAGGVTL